MEMIEHPDISAVMRYGELVQTKRRIKPGFLYGFAYEDLYDAKEDEYGEEDGHKTLKESCGREKTKRT